jgi:hypothetical protein
VRASGVYDGDLVADELHKPGALAAALRRPTVYVRGPMLSFTNATPFAKVTAQSFKDALVLCLLEPPADATEKVLLDPVRSAYSGGHLLESRTANVRRLHEAVAGLPLLGPEWDDRARHAASTADVQRMRSELDRAGLDRVRAAAKSELLLAAIDEPGEGNGPTELDGERQHHVRVVLVDVRTQAVLLRVRRPVDPAWISAAKRPTYASGLDSCRLAVDIHRAVSGAR